MLEQCAGCSELELFTPEAAQLLVAMCAHIAVLDIEDGAMTLEGGVEGDGDSLEILSQKGLDSLRHLVDEHNEFVTATMQKMIGNGARFHRTNLTLWLLFHREGMDWETFKEMQGASDVS